MPVMSLRDRLAGAVVMGPMTKGSNLPYRRLCVELGARVTVSEMAVARRLKQKRRGEFALVRRAPDEPFFGVQLAGTNPDEMAWAAALVEARGADFVDINLGCPIDYFTRKGSARRWRDSPAASRGWWQHVARRLGAGDGEDPSRLERQDAQLPRRGARCRRGGAQAIFVHGRTREARYRLAADWDAIGEVAAAVPVPVVGNGDLLFPHEIAERSGARRLRRRDGRARRADQAVDLRRDGRRLSRSGGRRARRAVSSVR